MISNDGKMTMMESNGPATAQTAFTAFAVIAAITIAIGGLLFGFDTAVISGAILFVRAQFHLTSFQTELAVSIVLAGALVGAGIGGFLGDHFGRKPVLALTALDYSLFGVLTGFSDHLWSFIAARFCIGLAVGISSMLTPLYIAELAPARIRGALVTLNQIAMAVGVVSAYFIDYVLAPSANWRWMFISAVFPSAMLVIGLLFLPETPRWLATRKRFDEAFQVLLRIESNSDAERDLHELSLLIATDRFKFRDLLRSRFKKPLIIGIGLAIFQQITGVNTIVYYAPTIFQLAGFGSKSTAIWTTFIIGTVALGTTVISMFLVDRIGRRPLLLISIAVMTVALLHLGFTFGLNHPSPVVIVADTVAYLAAFNFGLGPVFWLLISEIYPTTVRAQAMSLASVAIWFGDFVVTGTFLTVIDHLGMRGSFLMLAAICVAALVFSYVAVPETRGKTLEQIEHSWQEA